MAVERHLKSAPIKEAIIEFQVELPEQITIENLKQMSSKLTSDYPNISQLVKGRVGIQVNEGAPIQTEYDHTIEGYRFTSSDDGKVLQIRLNGFSFSQMKPYQTWEDLKHEAKRLWAIYINDLKPRKVNRISTRYINVMPIPLPIDKLEDILTAPPQIPHDLTQDVSSFSTRIVSKDVEIDATSIVTQVFDTIVADHARIILDIDVFVKRDFLPNESLCWDYLDELRKYKNKIFFSSITEKTVRLFE